MARNRGNNVNVLISGAGATGGAAIRGLTTRVTLSGPADGLWPETVAEAERIFLGTLAARKKTKADAYFQDLVYVVEGYIRRTGITRHLVVIASAIAGELKARGIDTPKDWKLRLAIKEAVRRIASPPAPGGL